MRPLLIGEASSQLHSRPFDGRAGLLLARLAGLTLDGFLDRVEAVNLLRRWPGRQDGPKGHLFPMDAAQRSATRLDVSGRRVILAGKRVAAAFGLREPPWLEAVELGRGERSAVVLPHPSGIVRWWNVEWNRRAARKVLSRLLKPRKTRKARRT